MNLIELELLGSKPGDCLLGYGNRVNRIVNNDWETFKSKALKDKDYCILTDILNNHFDVVSLQELSIMLIEGTHNRDEVIPLFENVFGCKINRSDKNILKFLLDNYHHVCTFIPKNEVAEFVKSQSLYNAGKNWKHLAGKGKLKEVCINDIWYKENR